MNFKGHGNDGGPLGLFLFPADEGTAHHHLLFLVDQQNARRLLHGKIIIPVQGYLDFFTGIGLHSHFFIRQPAAGKAPGQSKHQKQGCCSCSYILQNVLYHRDKGRERDAPKLRRFLPFPDCIGRKCRNFYRDGKGDKP